MTEKQPQPERAERFYRDTPGNEGPEADVEARRERPTPPASELRAGGPDAEPGQANDLSGSSEPIPLDDEGTADR